MVAFDSLARSSVIARSSVSRTQAQIKRNKRLAQRTSRQMKKLPMKMRFWFTLLIVGLLLIGGLYWLGKNNWDAGAAFNPLDDSGTAVSTGFAGSGVQEYSTATEVLETLEVKGQAGASGYSRSNFGETWADIDGNGCDQRNDVLARDLQDIERDSRCRVLTGTLTDPYTAEVIDFKRGEKTSEQVPIDHVVALSNAWQTGAADLPEEERQKIANDPLNLQATGLEPNTSKSNQDASTWLPQAGYRCEYVARQISVKATYKLWVTKAEKKAMQQVLSTCPDQPAYRSDFS